MTSTELLKAINVLFKTNYVRQVESVRPSAVSEYGEMHDLVIAIADDQTIERKTGGGLNITSVPHRRSDAAAALLDEMKAWIKDNRGYAIVWRCRPAVDRQGSRVKVRFRAHTLSKAVLKTGLLMKGTA